MIISDKIPHDVGAERACLGAVLMSPDTLWDLQAQGVVPESFYSEPHRLIWRTYLECSQANEPMDPVGVAGRLERAGMLDKIGGYPYLVGLLGSCPMTSEVDKYAARVLMDARARALMTSCVMAHANLSRGGDFEGAAKMLGDTIEEGSPKPPTCSPVSDTAHRVVDRLIRDEPGAQALPTGIRELDEEHGRLIVLGKVILILGASGLGKSALMGQLAKGLAANGHPGCLFGLEMTRDEYMERDLANEGRISYSRIQHGSLTDEEKAILVGAHERIDRLPYWVDDDLPTMPEIYARTRRGVRTEGWQWIGIDHAHIVPASDDRMTEPERISEIAEYAQRIGKKCGVAVILCVQMNSDVKKRTDKRPKLGDIDYGKKLVQAASTALGLYRDDYYNPESGVKGLAEVSILKARFGRLGRAKMRWRGEFQRFDPVVG